jgi:hypothetical protein
MSSADKTSPMPPLPSMAGISPPTGGRPASEQTLYKRRDFGRIRVAARAKADGHFRGSRTRARHLADSPPLREEEDRAGEKSRPAPAGAGLPTPPDSRRADADADAHRALAVTDASSALLHSGQSESLGFETSSPG